MLNYAAELSDAVAGEKIFKFIEAVLINKTDIIMTYAQQLRQEGMQQGMQTRTLDIARTMLHKLVLFYRQPGYAHVPCYEPQSVGGRTDPQAQESSV